ncbi:hypothetical protein V9K67_09715 [Paraflavisolibacter sp. H34]|uniref:hypothetical protein n=1 Tax=Huijunlia imazamoxiresistens TaxID=3127457 RepID=UPI00301AA84B
MCKKNWISTAKTLCTVLLLSSVQAVFAQDNSPYSRYGLGNVVPNTNIVNRGMGGVSAAYSDVLSINFANPASYSRFQTFLEEKSKKVSSGRVLLDAGINFDSRTLSNPNQPEKFNSPNLGFSYLQIGMPLTRNWGLSFGLRPVTRIRYKINQSSALHNPNGSRIDSIMDQYEGSGGAFLPTIGSGIALKNFSIGANIGYLFGKKEYNSTRNFLNDSIGYSDTRYTTNSSFGGLFFNAGAQYRIKLKDASSKRTYLNLGVSGNWEQKISAQQDVLRLSFDPSGTTDTISKNLGAEGKMVYPASYTAGLALEHTGAKGNGWMLGTDLVQTKWNNYRFFNAVDSVQDNWELRVGGNFRPQSGRNYFSNVIYRAGFFLGSDYIRHSQELPVFGVSLGLGLPIANFNRLSPGQFTVINLGLEYARRGNDDNLLRENIFRLALGLNFSDLWFSKRKYD